MKFFKKLFGKKNKASAIGIIGGASGPTAIFMADAKEQKEFLAYAAEQITPCDRSFKQLEEYLIEKYHAISHTLLAHELDTLKANVILNCFGDVVERPAPLGENPTEKELRAYAEQDTSFYQARQYPAEKLGLEMKAYKLPGAPSVFKEETELKRSSRFRIASYTEDDVIVEMEMKSEYLCSLNGGKEVMDDLIMYRGVSEKDIKEKSNRFIAYAYTLKHMGRL